MGRRSAPKLLDPNFDTLEIMNSPYLRNPTVGDLARERGVDPVELIIDVALERNFDVFFVHQLTQQSDDRLIPLLKHPNVAMTFSNAGAHVSQIADASIQTHLLAYWVRERQAFTLEEAIPMITHRPATLWRLYDRGLLREGYAADITGVRPGHRRT